MQRLGVDFPNLVFMGVKRVTIQAQTTGHNISQVRIRLEDEQGRHIMTIEAISGDGGLNAVPKINFLKPFNGRKEST